MSGGVHHRRSLNLALLWCRPAATAPIGPLAWEPPYAVGVALEKTKKRKKEKDIKLPKLLCLLLPELFIFAKLDYGLNFFIIPF